MKRLIALFIAAVMCMAPAFAFAEDSQPENGGDQMDNGALQVVVPAKVKGVELSCSSKNNVTIKWNAVTGADGYKVYRWNKDKKKYVGIKVTSKRSYIDKGLKAYTEYRYRVKAYVKYENKEGKTVKKYGTRSDSKKIRTKVIVKKVKDVNAKGSDWNKVKITWDRVPGVTGYKVYRWNSSKGKYVYIGKTSKRKYVDKGLYPHSKYIYKVAAYKKYKGKSGKKHIKTGPKSSRDKAWTLKTVRGYRLGKPLKTMSAGSGYGWRGGEFHIGVDILKPKGTPVYAATSGYVYRSRSNYGGLGNGIVIKNKKGITTWYGHLSKRLVSQGSYVSKGQLIGKVGSTGNAGNCNHLHYEVWIDGNHYNPMNFY